MPFALTRLTKRQRSLIFCSTSLPVAMIIIVPALTDQLDPFIGFLIVLGIYWIFFCIPVALYFGTGSIRVGIDLKSAPIWAPFLAIMLPLILFFGAGTANWLGADIGLLAIALACALINGPLEELAWRRPFRANSCGQFSFEILGLFLFTLWHVPLYFSNGVSFDHGAVGLIGGAFFLGGVWLCITRASNSVGWSIASHTSVNAAGFIPMFASNFGT